MPEYGHVTVVLSGGMDSTALATIARVKARELLLVSFNYGQRHKKELSFARKTAEELRATHLIIDLGYLGQHLKGSALTDDINVPHGSYDADNMKITVVPNRNAIMIASAYGIAVANNSDLLLVGVHAGDHAIYPDCRPEFIRAMGTAMLLANMGFANSSLHLSAPFLQSTKADIVRYGNIVGTKWENTWSCYEGGPVACGRCGTCVERKEAFFLADAKDPITYADDDYWKLQSNAYFYSATNPTNLPPHDDAQNKLFASGRLLLPSF